MRKVIKAFKNIGETPLQALERVRRDEKIPTQTPMTYAGRLDPAAEGVLLLLVGEECKKKEEYTKLDKEYELEVMFGVETDTQDALGLIKRINIDQKKQKLEIDYQKYVGKFTQEYPTYSSKLIAAKEFPDEIPTKDVEIYSIKKLKEVEVSGHEAGIHALEIVSKVDGDFRQQDIGEEWYAFGQEFANFQFRVISLRVKCSSGTYMRSLAERMGRDVGSGAFAYSIKRTSIFQ